MKSINFTSSSLFAIFGFLGTFSMLHAPLISSVEPESKASLQKNEFSCDIGHGVKMEFVLIRPGTFMMGSAAKPVHDVPVHKVTITKPFYIGKYEVTQAQWKELTGANPSTFKDGPDADRRPVETVSWTDIQEKFMPKLAEKLPEGFVPRLPTEAEWEYSCRAGTTTLYCFGDDPAKLDEYGWYEGNSGKMTHPVGEKKPNAWGLYDMHGNVWEWCSDWKVDYRPEDATDPTGPETGDNKANRGGSWYFKDFYCRSARRSLNEPKTTRGGNIGFRVLVTDAIGQKADEKGQKSDIKTDNR